MPYDPTRSIQGGEDLSPTTLILNQLRKQGVPITPDNIRRAVMANARGDGPGVQYVPGLVSDSPGVDPNNKGARGGPPVGKRGSGSVAKQIENPPSVNLGGNPYGDEGPVDLTDRSKKTSAPPAASSGDGGFDWLNLLGLPMLGGGRDSLGPRPGAPQENLGNRPMGPNGRMLDVNPDMITNAGPQAALPPPDPRMITQQMAEPPPTDMESAMQKAVAARGAVPQLGAPDAVDLSGVRPVANPADVIGRGQSALPPGVSDIDAARAAIGPGGIDQPRIAGNVGVPEVPFASNPAIRGAPGPLPNRSNLIQSLIESLGASLRGVRK